MFLKRYNLAEIHKRQWEPTMSKTPALATNNVQETIFRIIAREAHDCDISRITPSSTLEELEVDSLNTINIAFALEDEWGIGLEPNEMHDLKIVGDLVRRVQDYIRLHSAAA